MVDQTAPGSAAATGRILTTPVQTRNARQIRPQPTAKP